MLARTHTIKTRVSALEAYVGTPEEHTGMTITSRLEAQHSLLLALRDDHNDLRRDFNDFRVEMREFRAHVEQRFASVESRLTSVEGRLTSVESRLTSIEDVMGKLLWGMTEIKNLLKQPDDSP